MGETRKKQKPSKPKNKRKVPPKGTIDTRLESSVRYYRPPKKKRGFHFYRAPKKGE